MTAGPIERRLLVWLVRDWQVGSWIWEFGDGFQGLRNRFMDVEGWIWVLGS